VPSMRAYFERGGESPRPGRVFRLAEVRLRAPIVPKKFFPPGTREHHEDLKRSMVHR